MFLRRERLSAGSAVVVILFAAVSCAIAGTSSGLTFLKIAPGARATAMGEAFAATDDDVGAMWFNPAGIGRISSLEVIGTHVVWFQGMSYEYLAGAYRLGDIGTLGLQLSLFNGGEIKETAPDFSETAKKIAVMALSIGIGYARELQFSGLSFVVGGSVKINSESLGNVKSSGVGIDVGATCRAIEKLNIGVSVQNFGLSKVKGDNLPLNLRAGVKYNITDELCAAGDIVLPIDHNLYICPGVEYVYEGMENLKLALRAGYKIGSDVTGSLSGISLGGGVLYKMEKMGFGADIAYVGYGDLGNVIRVSLLLRM